MVAFGMAEGRPGLFIDPPLDYEYEISEDVDNCPF
jgi:hypothetical protein